MSGCKGNPCYFPCSPVISYIPCILPVCPHSPRPHSGVLSGNLETPECSKRPPEHLTHHQAPLPGTPLYSPLPHSFLCMCHVILAGFPQSILFGSSLARSVVSSPCLYILFLYILFGSSLASLSDFLSILQGCPYSRILSPLRTESCAHLPQLLDTGLKQVIREAPTLPYTLCPILPPLPLCTLSP